MKQIQIFLFLIMSFSAFANTSVYQGDIAGRKIMLYIDDTLSPELDAFYLFDDDPMQVHIPLILDYNSDNIYFDELDSWVLYDKSCYGEKEPCSFMKLNNIELNEDLQTLKNDELIGTWFNAYQNKKYTLNLKRKVNINFEENNEFNDLELLQAASSDRMYFTAILSKKKNELVRVTGINIYSKKDRNLIQKIKNLNYFYNSFYSVELGDYNFDGVLDLAISKRSVSSMPNKEYEYYIYENDTFMKLPLLGFNFVFDKEHKLAKSEKICIEQKKDGGKITTTIFDIYILQDRKFIHTKNFCNIHNEQLSQDLECSQTEYIKCGNTKQ